jgi:hypothetical protein
MSSSSEFDLGVGDKPIFRAAIPGCILMKSSRSRVGLLLAVTVLFALSVATAFPRVHAQGFTTVWVTPNFVNGTPAHTINITVNVNLAAGVSINEFDAQLNYTGFRTVLQAERISAGNIFQGLSPSPFAICVDGQIVNGTKCASYNSGQVEFSQYILGNELIGPVQGTLFSALFNITGTGRSILSLSYAHLVDPGPNPYFATAHFIQVETIDGVFGNTGGLVAFFNILPPSGAPSPVLLPGELLTFDASASFNSSSDQAVSAYSSKANYSWDFGGIKQWSSSPIILHTFSHEGNFSVTLTVSDGMGHSNTITQTAVVVSSLGGLDLTVNDMGGNPQRQNAVVQIFNGSSTVPFENRTTDPAGGVLFTGLVAGSYTLQVSGAAVLNKTVTESVIEGWTTQDTLYLALKPSPPPNYTTLISLSLLAGAVAVFGVLLIRKRYLERKRPLGSSQKKSKKTTASSGR